MRSSVPGRASWIRLGRCENTARINHAPPAKQESNRMDLILIILILLLLFGGGFGYRRYGYGGGMGIGGILTGELCDSKGTATTNQEILVAYLWERAD